MLLRGTKLYDKLLFEWDKWKTLHEAQKPKYENGSTEVRRRLCVFSAMNVRVEGM